MNVRYDNDVHAEGDGSTPLCGTSMLSAFEPELTTDLVNCWECKAITD